ncbi:cupredoxin domain-containing protein [Tritonibacter scottomollicae]|uniref:cupredoxin domain-containing protein n=1 Tax=Tritonibacter scottomollicae TaxID=483013 RepID=UPI003AA7F512
MRSAFVVLFALAFCSSCATTHMVEPQTTGQDVDFARATHVQIRLSNFEFSPKEIRLQAGTPYVLDIINVASGSHNFTAPEFFAAGKVAPEDAQKISDGQIEVPKNQSRAIRIVPATGTYRLVCTHFGHSALGMRGDIVVE